MKHALYIIGEPGAGKSTLVEHLTDGILSVGGRKPLAHTTYLTAPAVVELGARRPGGFGGTDALAMSAVVPAEAWVRDEAAWPDDAMLLAEGDRLACDRFFNALTLAGWNLTVAHLDTPPHVAAERRAARGSAQNETWLRGRATKVARLVERWSWDGRVTYLDGCATPRQLARHLAMVNPVAANLYPLEEPA